MAGKLWAAHPDFNNICRRGQPHRMGRPEPSGLDWPGCLVFLLPSIYNNHDPYMAGYGFIGQYSHGAVCFFCSIFKKDGQPHWNKKESPVKCSR